jgi:hypothetical protein
MINDLEQAREELSNIKVGLKEYLLKTLKNNRENPEQEADDIYHNLASVIDKIVKRRAYTLKWGPGGTPEWHLAIMNYLTKWISLETKISQLLNDTLID